MFSYTIIDDYYRSQECIWWFISIHTVSGQDSCNVLLAEGANCQQHGWPLRGNKAEGHVLPGPALCECTGGLRAPVLHHWERLLEGVGHWGLSVKGHWHLCRDTQRKKWLLLYEKTSESTFSQHKGKKCRFMWNTSGHLNSQNGFIKKQKKNVHLQRHGSMKTAEMNECQFPNFLKQPTLVSILQSLVASKQSSLFYVLSPGAILGDRSLWGHRSLHIASFSLIQRYFLRPTNNFDV